MESPVSQWTRTPLPWARRSLIKLMQEIKCWRMLQYWPSLITSFGVTEEPITKYSNLVGYIGSPTFSPRLRMLLMPFLSNRNLLCAAEMSPSQRFGRICVIGATRTLWFYLLEGEPYFSKIASALPLVFACTGDEFEWPARKLLICGKAFIFDSS